MSDSRLPDQIPLFDDDAVREPDPSPRPWRATPADTWRQEALPPVSVVEQTAVDLLRRNLEFLRAMDLHAGTEATRIVRGFRERHEELPGLLVRWQTDEDEDTARETLGVLRELADLRLQALNQLDPARLRKVMAAESRVRVRGPEAERALRRAEFDLAEERGELVEIEIPLSPDSFASAGLVGPDMVEDLKDALIAGMKEEQERRPLPPRGGLSTLLRDLPVVWLDAVWQALELGPERPPNRKERERTIARHLTAEMRPELVDERLSEQERQLLAFLLERGGEAPARDVVRRFGSDDDDGWFWNEEPPASPLGRVRVHGLAFVGASPAGHPTRTVLVPRELRQGLKDALAQSRAELSGEGHLQEAAPPCLRPELVQALEEVYPDGVVEPVRWDVDLLAVEREVETKLADLEEAQLLYRRRVGGGERWDLPDELILKGDTNEEEWREEGEEKHRKDEPAWADPIWSYGLYFLSPRAEGFQFEIMGDFIDEDGDAHPTTGASRVGWAVAVSGLAPFALLRVTSLDAEERLGVSRPDIESRSLNDAGRSIGEDEVFQEMLEPDERDLLDDVRGRIVRVLESLGIYCLSDEELAQPVPWLTAGESGLGGGVGDRPFSVEGALFFRYFA